MTDVQLVVRSEGHDERRVVTAGTTAAELFADDRSIVVAKVNDELRDLTHPLADGDVVEPVAVGSPEGLAVLRHSAAHVLAQAVQEVDPKARLGIGPPIRDGFYYDFDVDEPFTPEDLKALEKVDAADHQGGARPSAAGVVTDADDARAELADRALQARADRHQGRSDAERRRQRGTTSEAEVEAAAEGASTEVEVGEGELTHLRQPARDGEVAWKDLCRGPAPAQHPVHRQRLPADAQRRRLLAGERAEPAAAADLRHRLAESKDELKAYTRPRSPRPSGATTAGWASSSTCSRFPDEIGSGLPVFHPQRRRDQAGDGGLRPPARHIEEGASSTSAPRTSRRRTCSRPPGTCPTTPTPAHVPDRWSSRTSRQDYYLKAMNCPMHNLIFKSARDGPTGSCRCGSSSSGRCTGTRSPGSCTG